MVMWARKAERREARPRGQLIARIEATLRKDNPRLLMTGIVAATAAAGMIASVVLHHGGIRWMSLRYGLSVAFAYAAFMFFVWLWIASKRRERHRDPGDDTDWSEDGEYVASPGGTQDGTDLYEPAIRSHSRVGSSPVPGSSSGGDVGGGSLDLDDAIVIGAVGAAIVAAAAASLYVVMIAPQLLAELLLDGVFATIFWRRIRAGERRHWLDSALSRTWIPALCTAIVFVIAGAVCQWYAPEASSLGGVLAHMHAK